MTDLQIIARMSEIFNKLLAHAFLSDKSIATLKWKNRDDYLGYICGTNHEELNELGLNSVCDVWNEQTNNIKYYVSINSETRRFDTVNSLLDYIKRIYRERGFSSSQIEDALYAIRWWAKNANNPFEDELKIKGMTITIER